MIRQAKGRPLQNSTAAKNHVFEYIEIYDFIR